MHLCDWSVEYVELCGYGVVGLDLVLKGLFLALWGTRQAQHGSSAGRCSRQWNSAGATSSECVQTFGFPPSVKTGQSAQAQLESTENNPPQVDGFQATSS